MKILAVADIHAYFEEFDSSEWPDADAVVIAGDITNSGRKDAFTLARARRWFSVIQEKYGEVLWVPGNHDIGIDADTFGGVCLWKRVIGWRGLKCAGVSMSPCYGSGAWMARLWANMTDIPDDEQAAYRFLPEGLNILVSHCPPLGTLDSAGLMRREDGTWSQEHIGSKALLEHIERGKPKLVICGHVHGHAGEAWIGETRVVNVAQTPTLIKV